MNDADRIRIEKIRVFGRHGVFPEERERGQDFFVSLELELGLRRAGETDALEETVNYADVVAAVVAVVSGAPVNLIERLAEKIAGTLLRAFPKLARVAVEVHKPGAPLPAPVADVSVRILRARAPSDR